MLRHFASFPSWSPKPAGFSTIILKWFYCNSNIYVTRAYIQLAQSWLKKSFRIVVFTPASDDFVANSTIWFLKHFETSHVHSETLHLEKYVLLWYAPGKGNPNIYNCRAAPLQDPQTGGKALLRVAFVAPEGNSRSIQKYWSMHLTHLTPQSQISRRHQLNDSDSATLNHLQYSWNLRLSAVFSSWSSFCHLRAESLLSPTHSWLCSHSRLRVSKCPAPCAWSVPEQIETWECSLAEVSHLEAFRTLSRAFRIAASTSSRALIFSTSVTSARNCTCVSNLQTSFNLKSSHLCLYLHAGFMPPPCDTSSLAWGPHNVKRISGSGEHVLHTWLHLPCFLRATLGVDALWRAEIIHRLKNINHSVLPSLQQGQLCYRVNIF